MARIKIFTNSVSDIPPEMAEEYGIGLIPDIVVAEGVSYRSNLDITPPQLFELLPTVDRITSSHPNISFYLDAFRSIGPEVEEILCINLSSILSGSFNTSSIARDMLEEEGFPAKITTYDSLQTSFGQGIMALEAARMANRGCSMEEILQMLDYKREHMGVYFMMQSLHYARKGGRVGAIRVLAADVLGVKPVLTFRDGTLRDIGIVRKMRAGLEKILGYYEQTAKRGGDVYVFQGVNMPDAEFLRDGILQIDPDANVSIQWIGPAIGIYTGAGVVGVAFEEQP